MDEHAPFAVNAGGGAGLSWRGASGPQFVAPTRGVRLPRSSQANPLALIRAHALTLPQDAFFCNASAALLYGLPLPRRLEFGPVAIAVPEGDAHARRTRARGRRLNITPDELTMMDGLPVTSIARTFVDLAGDLQTPDLMAAGDDALHRGLMTREEVQRVYRRRLRFKGKVRAREVAALLDSRSESPQESRVRAHCIAFGFGSPAVQFEVYDTEGLFIARIDLAFPDLLIALEYDGEHHASSERRDRDAWRRTRLRSLGWYVVELTAVDVRIPTLIQNKVRAAMGVQLSAFSGIRKGRQLHRHRGGGA
jgi:hypothetical protein